MLETTIPPRPATFTPTGAPPGVDVRLDVFGAWPASRPIIRPRVAIVHTNGASVEASVQSSINYGNAGASNTKPHYHVGDRPAKVLATNRRAIANATGDDLQAATGEVDCALWSIAIETADMGSRAATAAGIAWPGDCGPFLTRPGAQPDDDEIVARILAYESIVWDFPLRAPQAWNGTGVAAHTVPFPFPHYTIQRGKTCPGRTKADQLFGQILVRAQAIRDAWLGVTPPPITPPIIPGDAMYHVIDPSKSRVLDTRKPTKSNAGGNEGKPLGRVTVHAHRAGLPDGTVAVAVNLAAAEPGGGGFLTAWPSGTMPDTSCVNYSTPGDTRSGFTIVGLSGFGTFELAAGGASAHAVVDIVGAFTR